MTKLVILYRKDLGTSSGKMGAQCVHAGHGAFKSAEAMDKDIQKKWANDLERVVVLEVENLIDLKWYYYLANNMAELPCFAVVDAGLTEVEEGTMTCLGIGPWDNKEIDRITGQLRLYTDETAISLWQKIRGYFGDLKDAIRAIFL